MYTILLSSNCSYPCTDISDSINSLQGDQLNMAMFFWHLGKSDLSNVGYWTRQAEKVTFYKVPEKHGHVSLITLLFKDKLHINGQKYISYILPTRILRKNVLLHGTFHYNQIPDELITTNLYLLISRSTLWDLVLIFFLSLYFSFHV